ncbi:MAG TPA: MEDS domain-containing protein [Actinoplanes sp.]
MRSAPSDRDDVATRVHVCWAYDDAAALVERAHDFLAAGIAAGCQVWYVAESPVPVLAERLSAPVFRFVALDSAYVADHPTEPAARVAAYRDATERAIADGYRGLRVAADVTPLVRSAADLEAFARYEHLVDRYMTTAPLTGMCGYDRSVLGDRTIAELACLHPLTNTPEVLFRLHAGAGATVLGGELDPSNADVFAVALERADPPAVAGEIAMDATHLEFIDHRALMTLDEHARRRGAVAVLYTPPASAARLIGLLDLTHVRAGPARVS